MDRMTNWCIGEIGSFWLRDEEKPQRVFVIISTSGTPREVGYDYGTQN
jgi:hypothetical protein